MVETKRAKTTDAMEDVPAAWRNKDLASVMLWYYWDKESKRQGPFYPGQMRQWFVAGFFPQDQRIAPSFKGEVPRHSVRLDQLFTRDTAADTAFLAHNDVALWPTAQAQPGPDDDVDEDDDKLVMHSRPPSRPQWLEDSIQRQKAGIKRKMIYGPVERENYN
ncbi:hypothetical protein CTAYLR_006035 [Chrysophaeum taylorii]|uniref:GYF domain-containing protein n=1 Tax=Chrysophaeum taylorii TaxID=2483200 RepID=A0AAD7UL08_9STRA|nr:hypothetical protein CTAYLR_006035 [Chrysophaeum taylorii]